MNIRRIASIGILGLSFAAVGFTQDSLTFLGAMTAPAPRPLAAQLKLPAGMGLVVIAVDSDSPAASALKVDDVLTKLDDQRLVDPSQLGVLVRSYKGGDEVTLSYLRDGAEQSARVKLVERAAGANASDTTMTSGGADGTITVRTTNGRKIVSAIGPDGSVTFSGPFDSEAERAAAPASVRAKVAQIESSARSRGGVRGAGGAVGGGGSGGGGGGGGMKSTVTLGAVGMGGTNSRASYTDTAGSVELITIDGRKSAVVLGVLGEVLFTGPFGTEAERAAAPSAVRARIEEIERKIVARPSAR